MSKLYRLITHNKKMPKTLLFYILKIENKYRKTSKWHQYQVKTRSKKKRIFSKK